MPPPPPRPPAPPGLAGGGRPRRGGDSPPPFRRLRPPEVKPAFNLIEFVRGTRLEMRKTLWPGRDGVTNWAGVAAWVMVITVALALLLDLFAAAALDWLRP